MAPTNIFAHEAREGGAMALHMFGALFLHAHDAQEIKDDPAAQRLITEGMENLRELVCSMPFKPGYTPLRVLPNLEKTLFDYYYRGSYDEFWSQECCDQASYFHKSADIPGVFSGGWYDPFVIATTDQFVAMSKKNKSPQRLLLGPWSHVAMRGKGTSRVGDVDFGPAASFGDRVYNELRLRWFDRWLKDVQNGVENDPPVRIFVMGGGTGRQTREGHLHHGGQWRDENEWPLARTRWVKYYLRSDGQLSTQPPQDHEPALTYTHDPDHPVPTMGGAVTGFYELVEFPEGINKAYITPRARMRPAGMPLALSSR